ELVEQSMSNFTMCDPLSMCAVVASRSVDSDDRFVFSRCIRGETGYEIGASEMPGQSQNLVVHFCLSYAENSLVRLPWFSLLHPQSSSNRVAQTLRPSKR